MWRSPGIFELKLHRNGMPFVPGDCVALFGSDEEESRPYSLASGRDDQVMSFVIRRMPGGVVSTFLSERKPGDEVRMSPPFGWFRPGQAEGNAPSVFIATGTGIAPFMSYLNSFPERPPVKLLYGVRFLEDAVDLDRLQDLCDLRLAVSGESVPGYHHGRVTGLLEQVPISNAVHYYLCGLDTMIDDVTIWLEKRGVPVTHIHRECFFNASYGS